METNVHAAEKDCVNDTSSVKKMAIRAYTPLDIQFYDSPLRLEQSASAQPTSTSTSESASTPRDAHPCRIYIVSHARSQPSLSTMIHRGL
ncbi:hypothetical protein HETIRDRAFT_412335 [Heterobasidion irregulare TC 32-1]|uniref:Uncharacterized protein n=1 Tax=Heterobasidion irregulare (strain TC 32-1) TaxID=747525 RepID=W4JRK1_HETIT|nr:uncharacterized protein HETIRDRAFT_412335 [Heterobasidion irregulare TC 32-1]ETW76202.1 hypothetical protein HETIRDRAFT_412335 [Heterobasidion irregulare TC 32-1]